MSQRAFLQKRGFVFIEDEWDYVHIRIWQNSIISNGMGAYIDAQIVFAYAKKYKLKKISTLEIVNQIQGAVNAKRLNSKT